MPNNVYQTMTVDGDQNRVDKFFENHFSFYKNDEPYFDFNTFLPMPKDLDGTTSPVREPDSPENRALREKHGYDNWYDWKCNNWGTKWNSYENIVDRESKTVSFQTAWSMPDPIFAMMAKSYPDLRFHLEVVEEGGWFAGTVDIANGEVVENLTKDYEVWKQYAVKFMGWTFEEDEED